MYHTFTRVTHGGSNVFRIKYPEFFYEKHTVNAYLHMRFSKQQPRRRSEARDFQRCVFYGVVKSDTRVKVYMKDIRHQLYAWRSLLLRVRRPKVASSSLPVLSHPRHLICTSAKWAWPRVHARVSTRLNTERRTKPVPAIKKLFSFRNFRLQCRAGTPFLAKVKNISRYRKRNYALFLFVNHFRTY